MRLRIIVLVLSLLAFLSASTGGYLYYSSLKASAFVEAETEAAWRAQAERGRLSAFLREQRKTVAALAGLMPIRKALSQRSQDTLTDANVTLDLFNRAFRADVCYLMDRKGETLASSNRSAPDSFVGKNFSFRPYFKSASKGKPVVYMALGVTSKKRGVYFSHPVFEEGSDVPTGVAVLKASAELLEHQFNARAGETICLTDPHGIVFISNKKDWLFRSLRPLTPEQTARISKSMQFGSGPFLWAGLSVEGANRAIDEEGTKYLMHQMAVDGFDGWHVVYLHNLRSISYHLSAPLLSTTAPVILTLCVLIGVSVGFLYRKASNDIIQRRLAEEALRESELRYRSLYHNTPAMLYSIDRDGKLLSVSGYWTEALGYTREEAIGRNFTDFLTEPSRRYARQTLLPELLRKGYCTEESFQFVKKDGETIDVLLSAIAETDANAEVVRSLTVLMDVTERKRAENELKRAKEELSRYSKDLERQVAARTREINSILTYVPSVVFLKDKEFRYTMVNSQFELLYGIPEGGVEGKTDYDIFPTAVADQFRANDRLVMAENRAIQVEEHVPLDDGLHTYLSVKFPLYDEQGATHRICGIATDITAAKKAQDQLRMLSGRILAGQETERAAIARELHDELGQMLTAVRMESAWLGSRLKDADADAADRALTMCDLVDKTIDDVRGMALRLRPGVLDDLGLIAGLEWYTSDYEKRTGINCVFTHINVPAVDGAIATAAYRIAQEALTNVARHSLASRVKLTLEQRDGILRLAIFDEGTGFEPLSLSESEGLGIAGMRERAGLVGGSLEIRSESKKGTTVLFTVAINGNAGVNP